jgi:excisionase family DNA binding protein
MIGDHATQGTPALLTVPEACATLRVSRWMFYRLVQQRQLRTVKIGSRRLVQASALEDYLQRLATEAQS